MTETGSTAPALQDILRSFAGRIDPTDPIAHNDLGVFYHRRGMLPEAVTMFQRAVELDPQLEVAQRNIEMLAFARRGAPEFSEQVEGARVTSGDMRHTGAHRAVPHNTPISLTSARARAAQLRRAAEVNQMHGQVAEAIAAYRHALALDPSDGTARLNLALLLAERHAFTAALPPLVELLHGDPYNVPALAALGSVLERLDRIPDAAIAFSRVIRFDPMHENAAGFFRRRYTIKPSS
jgi:cellulose synthase operon protein C